MAVGVEKLKDSGYSGLVRANPSGDGTAPELTQTTPAAFSLLDPAYCAKYDVDPEAFRRAMTHVAWKNHANGALNPCAEYRTPIPKEKIEAGAGTVAGRLGVLDCSGVSDEAAAALIVRAEDALRYTDHPLYVKALSLIAGPASGPIDPAYDYTTFPEVVRCAEDAYRQAGIEQSAEEISLALFLKTEIGLALRATGVNAGMARSQGVNDSAMLAVSLAIANGLSGLGGALVVQDQSFADVNMGTGTLIAGIGAVLLGELLVRPGPSKVGRIVVAVFVGAIAYRLVLVGALRAGLPAEDLKGATAVTLIAAFAAQRYGVPLIQRGRGLRPRAASGRVEAGQLFS